MVEPRTIGAIHGRKSALRARVGWAPVAALCVARGVVALAFVACSPADGAPPGLPRDAAASSESAGRDSAAPRDDVEHTSDAAGAESAASDGAARDASLDSGPSTARDAAALTDARYESGVNSALGVVESIELANVWSGHPVGFALLTRGDQQFAAFYDADRKMTVAQRTLGSNAFKLVRLPETLGWDSHNYVTLASDRAGYLHVSGNMHAVPLVYFRSALPGSIDAMAAATMVGRDETSCTYPLFFAGPGGELVFDYRSGVSGNGDHIFNSYDPTTRTWSRLVNTPILDGQGTYNPYPVGPILGPDGFFHLVWTWRDTPDAATNHDLSYAKSRDLVHWQSATGRALTLPITLATSDIVDPVAAGLGLINNNTKVGFDAQQQPIVAYQKYDAAGATQLYDARIENGRWVSHRTSSWTYRWVFGGGGSLVFEVQVMEPVLQPNGDMIQEWYHAKYGGWGAFRLDPSSLAAVAQVEAPRPYPPALDIPESSTPGMGVRWAQDLGSGPDPSVRYMLRWETLEENRDQPRATTPPATKLRLIAVRQRT